VTPTQALTLVPVLLSFALVFYWLARKFGFPVLAGTLLALLIHEWLIRWLTYLVKAPPVIVSGLALEGRRADRAGCGLASAVAGPVANEGGSPLAETARSAPWLDGSCSGSGGRERAPVPQPPGRHRGLPPTSRCCCSLWLGLSIRPNAN
jgi:hypothetical protein